MMDSLRYALIDEYAQEWMDLFLCGRETDPKAMGVPADILTDLIDEINRRRFHLTAHLGAEAPRPCPCMLCRLRRGERPIAVVIVGEL